MSDKKKYVWDEIEVDENESFDQFKEVKPDVDEQEEDEPKKPKKEKKVRKKKNFSTKLVLLIIGIILFLIIMFVPFFSVTAINMNETHFNTKENVTSELGIAENDNINLFKYILMQFTLSDDSILDYSVKYSFKESAIYINIEEIKPLAYSDNELYYYNGKEIVSSDSLFYDAPTLISMDNNLQMEVLEELNTLDYETIKLIDEIQANTNVINTELLLLKMKDGNLVEINISQIHEKMPYYEEIASIIEANGSEPGIIHLNIGDYYEPN